MWWGWGVGADPAVTTRSIINDTGQWSAVLPPAPTSAQIVPSHQEKLWPPLPWRPKPIHNFSFLIRHGNDEDND